VQAELRDEVLRRAADITELTDLLHRAADLEVQRLTEQRAEATRELADAEAALGQARQGLPINESDLIDPRTRAEAIAELRSRTMR
ncbi:hypothetical protein, partial [Streptomyces sp. JW3]